MFLSFSVGSFNFLCHLSWVIIFIEMSGFFSYESPFITLAFELLLKLFFAYASTYVANLFYVEFFFCFVVCFS